MNTRQQVLEHHHIKAEIGINIVQEVVRILGDSIPNVKNDVVNLIKTTLVQAAEDAIEKYKVEVDKKAE